MVDAELTERIIGCAMRVHRVLGPGFVESVYGNSFAHEMRKARLVVECNLPVPVWYDGVNVGDFKVDILVERRVIIETKAVLTLAQIHEVQLVNYLTATAIEIGLLINFGAEKLQFRRKYRTYRKKGDATQRVLPPGT